MQNESSLVRLQKYMADQGIASRRKAEELIRAGKVEVNGEKAHIGQKVDPAKDEVNVFAKGVAAKSDEKVVFAFHKPKGVTSTTRKFRGEKNIMSYLPKKYRLFPAGRLDKDSRGLMILTNDGELAQKITHPSKKTEKEYLVKVRDELSELDFKRVRRGIHFDGEQYKIISIRPQGLRTYRIVLKEGKKRHIRMIFRALHNPVIDLFRKRIGEYEIGDLQSGKYKQLNEKEIKELLS